jgi:hypothetical protein
MMTEIVGLSRGLPRRNSGLFAALKLALSRLAPGARANPLRVEEWPDYLLRDIGLDRAALDPEHPRPTNWLGR